MPIYLDHTIVPTTDKEASARFFAKIFGLEYKGPWGHFAPVKVNETLSLDFDNRDVVEHHHYAFIVSEEEFDTILDRVKGEGLAYGSGPMQDDMQINHLHTGRGFYFNDPNELRLDDITHTYICGTTNDEIRIITTCSPFAATNRCACPPPSLRALPT